LKFLFFLLPFLVFALDINVDYYQGNKKSEILTLYNDFPFICKKENKKILCIFNKVPTTAVFKTQTKFFKLTPLFKKNKFILQINCKSKYFIFSKRDNLYKNPLNSLNKLKQAKKWIIIANYEPFLTKRKPNGLDFYFHNSPRPFVGAIDENQNPITINDQAADVIKYFNILKKFKMGRDVSIDLDNFIKNYPNSVFIPDILYMKMVTLFNNNDFEDVVSIGKKWIKKFSYDDKLPKVLLLMARAYSNMGFLSDASYFFNRIITEYPNTKESDLATIYLADQLYSSGDSKKAMKLYENVLFSTNDINIASLAAIRLASRYMDKGNFKKAYEYYKKIYNANKEFLLKDKNKAYNLAKLLADHNMYTLAINIGENLLKKLKKFDDLYEPLLYHLAVWSYENKDYEKALKYINLYLKIFPYGDYSDQLNDLRDKVLFNLPDNNLTQMLNNINKILKEYKNSVIATKAMIKKAEILYKLKKYNEILDMENKLQNIAENLWPQKNQFLSKVKKEYALYLLKNKKCLKADEIINKYHLTLNKKYDNEIYKCAMEALDYNLASIICNKYLDSPNDKVFIKWMKRKIEALKGLNDNKNLIEAIDDLCQVYKNCYKYKIYKFFALWNLKKYNEALKTAENIRKKQIKNADVYINIVRWALQNNNYLLAAAYAKKIIDLQNLFKAYPYSPFVDFVFAKYTKNKKDAIRVLKNLLNRVKGENKARALFMLANLTKQKKYLDECLKVKGSTLWKSLCKDAQGLF